MTEIYISGYAVQPQAISLGTKGSMGIETLSLFFDETWDGLEKQIIFLAGESEALPLTVPVNGEIKIPAAATRTAGWHDVVVSGIAQGKVIYSCAISAYVQPQPADLADLETSMPDLISQYVAETRQDRLDVRQAAKEAAEGAEKSLERLKAAEEAKTKAQSAAILAARHEAGIKQAMDSAEAEAGRAAQSSAAAAASAALAGQQKEAVGQAVTDAEAAAQSAVTAEQAAEAAQAGAKLAQAGAETALTEVQAVRDAFAGYTKAESRDAFAGALEGSTGPAPRLEFYPQPGTALSPTVYGTTRQQSEGTPSPDNVRPILPTAQDAITLRLTDGGGQREFSLPLTAPLYGTGALADTYECGVALEAARWRRYEVTGRETWIAAYSTYDHASTTDRYMLIEDHPAVGDSRGNGALCDRLPYLYGCWDLSNDVPAFCVNAGSQIHLNLPNEWLGVAAGDDTAARTQKMAAWLERQYTAGTPVTVIYPLAAPEPDPADPTRKLRIDRETHRGKLLDVAEITSASPSAAASDAGWSDCGEVGGTWAYYYYKFDGGQAASNSGALCNMLPCRAAWSEIVQSASPGFFIGKANGINYLALRLDRAALTPHGFAAGDAATHLPALRAWLAAQKAAGTPLQILYRLDAPQTYAHGPLRIEAGAGQTVLSLVDDNKGSISCRYNSRLDQALETLAKETKGWATARLAPGIPAETGIAAGHEIFAAADTSLQVTVQGRTRQEGAGDPTPDNVRPIKGLEDASISTTDGKAVRAAALPLTAPLCGDGKINDTVENWADSGCDAVLVLDGKQAFFKTSGVDNDGSHLFSISHFTLPNTPVYSDILPSLSSRPGAFPGLQKGISIGDTGALMFNFMECNTREEMKAYLAEHPLTVWYRSADYTPARQLPLCLETRRWKFLDVAEITSASLSASANAPGSGWADCGEEGTTWAYQYHKFDGGPADSNPGALCNMLPCRATRGEVVKGTSPCFFIGKSDGDFFITLRLNRSDLIPHGFAAADYKTYIPAWRAWLAAQKAAGTPLQILYQLAVPEVYAHAPLPLPAWGSLPETATGTGEISVTYSADTKHYIDGKFAALENKINQSIAAQLMLAAQ